MVSVGRATGRRTIITEEVRDCLAFYQTKKKTPESRISDLANVEHYFNWNIELFESYAREIIVTVHFSKEEFILHYMNKTYSLKSWFAVIYFQYILM